MRTWPNAVTREFCQAQLDGHKVFQPQDLRDHRLRQHARRSARHEQRPGRPHPGRPRGPRKARALHAHRRGRPHADRVLRRDDHSGHSRILPEASRAAPLHRRAADAVAREQDALRRNRRIHRDGAPGRGRRLAGRRGHQRIAARAGRAVVLPARRKIRGTRHSGRPEIRLPHPRRGLSGRDARGHQRRHAARQIGPRWRRVRFDHQKR